MFSKFSEKTRAAIFLAIGMGCFLLAGSLVYFFPKSQYVSAGAEKEDDRSAIQGIYQDIAETDSGGGGNAVSLVQSVPQTTESQIRIINEPDDRWVVYVTGCVKNPGVYRLPEGARTYQLIDAAGGFNMVADAEVVNLAAPLQDGDHLHVPQKGDDDSVRNRNRPSNGTSVYVEPRVGEGTVREERRSGGRSSRSSQKSPRGGSVDINSASEAELQELPGIGPALSARIVRYRDQNGRFRQTGDLINVPGIGAKKLESIEPFVSVR